MRGRTCSLLAPSIFVYQIEALNVGTCPPYKLGDSKAITRTARVLRALHPPSTKRVLRQQKRHPNLKMVTSQPLLESFALTTHPLSSHLEKLKHKHAPEHNEIRVPPSSDGMQALQVSEDKALGAIRSFPAGSAAGPDGIRPQHLLELVQSREAGPRLLTSVTAFANLLLAGNCHSDYQHILFGGKLLALDKSQGASVHS